MSVKVQFINTINNYKEDTIGVNPTLAQLWSCICHQNYFQTSKVYMTWIIWKVNRIPMHCGAAYESVLSLARSHVIRV